MLSEEIDRYVLICQISGLECSVLETWVEDLETGMPYRVGSHSAGQLRFSLMALRIVKQCGRVSEWVEVSLFHLGV